MDLKGKLTAAPVTVKFLDGTAFQFSPLTDKDIDEIDLWLQSKVIEIARNSLSDNLSQKERDETLSLAIKESVGISLFNARGASAISTPAGMVHLLWMCIRKHHPDAKEAQLHELLIGNPNNIEILVNSFKVLNQTPDQKVKPKNRLRARLPRN